MKTIAIVGSIGAGKSRMLKAFEASKHRTHCVNLDLVAKQLREVESSLTHTLVTIFDNQILDNNYVIDTVFTHDGLYQKLISIYSNYFYTYITNIKAQLEDEDHRTGTTTTLVIEGAALIHDPRLLDLVDKAVRVVTDPFVCAERVKARQRYTPAQILTLMYRTDPSKSYAWRNWATKDKVYEIESVDGCDLDSMLDWAIIGSASRPTLMEIPQRIAIYQGSFNPFHVGHLAVVQEISRLFDQVIVLRCINGQKVHGSDARFVYELDESKLPENAALIEWHKSFVEFLTSTTYLDKANVTIIRGIRNGADLQYENDYIRHLRIMYDIRKWHKPFPVVMYVPTHPHYEHISSSAIKAIEPFDPEYANSLKV